MKVIFRFSILLYFIFCINSSKANVFGSIIHISNSCSEGFNLTILNEKDTLINQFILDSKTSIEYKHPELRKVKILINNKRFYLMPQNEHKILLNEHCEAEFLDVENHIFNEGNSIVRERRRENRENLQKVFSDNLLSKTQKDNIEQLFTNNQNDINNYEFDYCMDNANNIAGFMMLKEFIKTKYFEKEKLIDLTNEFSSNLKLYNENFRKEFTGLLKKLHLPDKGVGDTLYSMKLSDTIVHIPSTKAFITVQNEHCYFSKLYFKKMEQDSKKLAEYDVIIFDTSNSEAIAKTCLKNNWRYVYSKEILKTNLSYKMWFNGTPFSFITNNNIIKKTDGGYNEDNTLDWF